MAKITISKRTVDAAKPGDRDAFLWDDDVKGFGLKVTPAGAKVYVFQYRVARPGETAHTPARRYTIGKHGSFTPEQARTRAKELAVLVATGIDPREQEAEKLAAKDESKRKTEEQNRLANELAFSRMAGLWLDHYESEIGRRPSSVRAAKMVVENHLKPALKDKPLPHIDRTDLQPIIDAIPIKQKAMRRIVFAYASVLFGWATKRGEIDRNPLQDMAKPEAPKARDRVLSDVELVAIWKAANATPPPFNSFYRLLILTGQRREEVAGINWAELDRSTATWTIPASRAKNGNVHIVPLSAPIIAELDALGGNDDVRKTWPKSGYVLTTTGKTPISGFSKAKRALDDTITKIREGCPLPAWRIHDLRRTLATNLQKLGVRFEVTEAVLNHVSGAKGGVAGIYQRHDWKDEKRAALEAWGRRLRELVHGTQADDNVVKLEVRA